MDGRWKQPTHLRIRARNRSELVLSVPGAHDARVPLVHHFRGRLLGGDLAQHELLGIAHQPFHVQQQKQTVLQLANAGNVFVATLLEPWRRFDSFRRNAQHLRDRVHLKSEDAACHFDNNDRVSLPRARDSMPSRFRRPTTGITRPRKLITPSMKSGAFGKRVMSRMRMISWTLRISIPNSSPPSRKLTS